MLLVVGILLIGPGMVGQSRPGAYKGHIALENVEHLGQLVQAGLAQDLAHPGDPGVRIVGVDAGAGMLGVDLHRAELVHFHHLAAPAQPLLAEEYRAAVVQLDGNGDDEKYGQQYRQTNQRKDKAHAPLKAKIDLLPKAVAKLSGTLIFHKKPSFLRLFFIRPYCRHFI